LNDRVHGYDLARAVAIVGMVFVNFPLVMNATLGSPALIHASQWLPGRAVALFVVLAGVGVTLFANSKGRTAVIWPLLRRALVFLIVGFAFLPIWPGDILHFYGLYFLIGVALLGWSASQLWFVITVLVVGFVAMILSLDYAEGWDFETLTYVDAWTLTGTVRRLFFNGFHPVFPCAVATVCVWLADQPALRHFLNPIIQLGRMSLTAYLLHVLIGIVTLDLLGFLNAAQTIESALFASALFCIAALVFANLWLRWFRQGPFEWVLRRLTG
jgi:uncharacterized membrane protein YeiB